MLYQRRHVFVGTPPAVMGTAFAAFATNPRNRNAVFLINPAVAQTSEHFVNDNTDIASFQVAMFKHPELLKDTRLITSPILTKDENWTISTYRQSANMANGDDTKADVLCKSELKELNRITGIRTVEEMAVIIRFNNVFDLSPGQKYFSLPFTMFTDTDGVVNLTRLNIELVKMADRINTHTYLSKFLTAVVQPDAPDAKGITITAKENIMDYSEYLRFPYEPIEFTASIARGSGEELPWLGIKDLVKETKAYISFENQYKVMDVEKDAQGYRGVANFTSYPATLPKLRTRLDRRYHTFIWNIARPYYDPADNRQLSSEAVQVYLTFEDIDSTIARADLYACWKTQMAKVGIDITAVPVGSLLG